MTVTSASLVSSSVNQFAASYAQGADKSQGRSDTFSHMLNEGMRQDKQESTKAEAAHREKPRKADSENNGKAASSEVPSAKQTAKAALTGKLGLSSPQQNAGDAGKGAVGKTPAGGDVTDASGVAGQAALADKVLSGSAVDTSSGSAIMAMLIQMKAGSAGLPGRAAANVDDSQDDQTPNPQTPDPAAGAALLSLPTPLALLAVQTAQGEGNPDATKKAAGNRVTGLQGSADAAPSDNEEGGVKPAAAAAHLAFALRLNASLDATSTQAAESKQQNQLALENSSLNAAPALAAAPSDSLKALAAGSEKKEHSQSESKDQGAALAIMDTPAQAAAQMPDPAVSESNTPVASQAPEIDDKALEYSTDTVRNVQMQVVGEDNRRVDVRLMDRAGELRVSVKSGDTTLNNTLQNNMPDLTSRLQSAQYKTEVWMPAAASPSQSSGESPATDRQTGPQRPAWVADLEGATPQL